MRTELLDIIKHTADTKIISKVIIKGTDEETLIDSNMGGLIVKGKTKAPIKDFNGEFVLNNLDILKGFASIESMGSDEAEISVKRKTSGSESYPEEIIFDDGMNTKMVYRCANIASANMNIPIERKYDWTISTTISCSKFAELQRISNILKYSEITIGTDEGYLTAWIGDPDSTSNKAKIALSEVDSEMSHRHVWKIDNFFAAAKLSSQNDENGDVHISILDKGLIMILSETDSCEFKFYIPRMS